MAYKKYTKASAVTPHDTNEVTGFAGTGWDGMYVGVSGNVTMILSGDADAVLFKNMVQGTIYNLSPKIIKSTATAATDMIVLDTDSYLS